MNSKITLNGIPVRKLRWNGYKVHANVLTGADVFVDYAEAGTAVHARATFAGTVRFLTPDMPILLLAGGALLAGCECWWAFEDLKGEHMSVEENAIILNLDLSTKKEGKPFSRPDPRCAKCRIVKACVAVERYPVAGLITQSKYCRRYGHGFARACGLSPAEMQAIDRRITRYLHAVRHVQEHYHGLVLPTIPGVT